MSSRSNTHGVQDPSSVSSLVSFNREATSSDGSTGGNQWSHVTKDGRFICTIHGNHIDVLESSSGRLRCAWTFGQADPIMRITAIVDVQHDGATIFIVGLSVQDVGVVCVLDMSLSRVTRAVRIPHEVRCVEVILAESDANLNHWVLVDQLKAYSGVVAVGTGQAHVYLLDMCLNDTITTTTEREPRHLEMITPRTRDIADLRDYAIHHGSHLCMHLDNESHVDDYIYHKPGAETQTRFHKPDVYISALRYVPQSGSLAVGFNFGCYQIWRLSAPVLEYSSEYMEHTPPITHFTHQEPENDPKNFSYMWVTHGQTPSHPQDNVVSSMVLYQLSYKKKLFYSRYGTYFEDLMMVGCRFEMFLTSRVFNHNTPCHNSTVLACHAITDHSYTPPHHLLADESFEESVHGPDLSLSTIVWKTTTGHTTHYFLGLFDLNRWYHSQMPTFFKSMNHAEAQCPYMAVYSLDSVFENMQHDDILTAHIGWESIRRYVTNAPIAPEQHYYPSSLQFDVQCALKNGVTKVQCLGLQRQALVELSQTGPRALIDPSHTHHTCAMRGLLPRFPTSPGYQPTHESAREDLLGLCIDNNMVSFIKTCVSHWPTDSDFAVGDSIIPMKAADDFVEENMECARHGCTLKFLLEWAWSKLRHTKETINRITLPLFDWSGMGLDPRSLHTLHTCSHTLELLGMVFRSFLTHATPTTEEGCNELLSKLEVCQLISQHLKAILWFVNQKLLPEIEDIDDTAGAGYSYPITELMNKYKNRCQQLNNLHSDLPASDLLLIDGLVSELGSGVMDMWDGSYPPPSLSELLKLYLTDSVSLTHKHALVLYVLLDLYSLHEKDPQMQEEFSDKITKFAQATGLSASITTQIGAFWSLDNQHFEEATLGLTNSTITDDFGPWQHARIIQSLLYQNQARLALSYIRIRQPPLCEPDLIKLYLTVLLANGLTSEALSYQRSCHDDTSSLDLMAHIIHGSQQMRTMKQLLEQPLTADEDAILCDYLRCHGDVSSQQLLVMHYLLRGRYMDAIRLNDDLKNTPATQVVNRQQQTTLNLIVDKYRSCLPMVQRALVHKDAPHKSRHAGILKQVCKPQPLSTVVMRSHSNQQRLSSRSDLLSVVMDKISEVICAEVPTVAQAPPKTATPIIPTTPHEPFVFTPMTPKSSRRLSTSRFVFPTIEPAPPEVKVNTSLMMTPTKPTNRRRSQIISEDALSMLKTPPVIRRSLSRLSHTLPQTPQPTPQSILKVRTLVRRTPSPLHSRDAISETALTPPLDTPKLSFMLQPAPPTPKQLRFADSLVLTSPHSPPGDKESTEVRMDTDHTEPIQQDIEIPTKCLAEERLVLQLISSSEDEDVSVDSPPKGDETLDGDDVCVESVMSPPHRQVMEVLDTSEVFHTPPEASVHRSQGHCHSGAPITFADNSSPVNVQEADSSWDSDRLLSGDAKNNIHEELSGNSHICLPDKTNNAEIGVSLLNEQSIIEYSRTADRFNLEQSNVLSEIRTNIQTGTTDVIEIDDVVTDKNSTDVRQTFDTDTSQDDNIVVCDTQIIVEDVDMGEDEIDYNPSPRQSIHSTPSPVLKSQSPIEIAKLRLAAQTVASTSPIVLKTQKLAQSSDLTPKTSKVERSRGTKNTSVVQTTEDEQPIPLDLAGSNVGAVDTPALRSRTLRGSISEDTIPTSLSVNKSVRSSISADVCDTTSSTSSPRRRGRPRKSEQRENESFTNLNKSRDNKIDIDTGKDPTKTSTSEIVVNEQFNRRKTVTLTRSTIEIGSTVASEVGQTAGDVNDSPEPVLRRSTRASSVDKSLVYTPPESPRRQRGGRAKSVDKNNVKTSVSSKQTSQLDESTVTTDMNTQTTPGLMKRVVKTPARYLHDDETQKGSEKPTDKSTDKSPESLPVSPVARRRSERASSVEKSLKYGDVERKTRAPRGKSKEKLSESILDSPTAVQTPTRRNIRGSSVEKSLIYTPGDDRVSAQSTPVEKYVIETPTNVPKSHTRRASSVDKSIIYDDPKPRRSRRASSVEKSLIYTPPDDKPERTTRGASVDKSLVHTPPDPKPKSTSTRAASVEKTIIPTQSDDQKSTTRQSVTAGSIEKTIIATPSDDQKSTRRRSVRAGSIEKTIIPTPADDHKSTRRRSVRAGSIDKSFTSTPVGSSSRLPSDDLSENLPHSPPKQSRRKSMRASSIEKSLTQTPPENLRRSTRAKSVDKTPDDSINESKIRGRLSSVEKTPQPASTPSTPNRRRTPKTKDDTPRRLTRRIVDMTPVLEPLIENEEVSHSDVDVRTMGVDGPENPVVQRDEEMSQRSEEDGLENVEIVRENVEMGQQNVEMRRENVEIEHENVEIEHENVEISETAQNINTENVVDQEMHQNEEIDKNTNNSELRNYHDQPDIIVPVLDQVSQSESDALWDKVNRDVKQTQSSRRRSQSLRGNSPGRDMRAEVSVRRNSSSEITTDRASTSAASDATVATIVISDSDHALTSSQDADSQSTASLSDSDDDNTSDDNTSEGHTSEGHTSEGHASEGRASEGHASEGHASEGRASEGRASEGHANEGQTSEGHTSEGHASEGHNESDLADDVFSPSIQRPRRLTVDTATLANTPRSPPPDLPPAKRGRPQNPPTPGMPGLSPYLMSPGDDSPDTPLVPTPHTASRRRFKQSYYTRTRKRRIDWVKMCKNK